MKEFVELNILHQMCTTSFTCLHLLKQESSLKLLFLLFQGKRYLVQRRIKWKVQMVRTTMIIMILMNYYNTFLSDVLYDLILLFCEIYKNYNCNFYNIPIVIHPEIIFLMLQCVHTRETLCSLCTSV